MATLAEIRNNPEAYLGDGEPSEYEAFIEAVERLMKIGKRDEQAAIEAVWNDGDWLPMALSIVRGLYIILV